MSDADLIAAFLAKGGEVQKVKDGKAHGAVDWEKKRRAEQDHARLQLAWLRDRRVRESMAKRSEAQERKERKHREALTALQRGED